MPRFKAVTTAKGEKMKRIIAVFATLVVLGAAVPAYAAAPQIAGHPLVDGIISTLIYSAVGIFVAFIAFKVIDLITPGHLAKDIADNNIALAILCGLTMLGVCIIIAAVLAS